jgi:hypothetical protein
MREAFVGPGVLDYFEGLLEAGATLLARNVEALEMDRNRAAANADVEPSVRQDIDYCRLLSDAQRMVKRQQDYARAKADLPCALRRCGGDVEWPRHYRELAEEMEFREPRHIEAKFICENDLLDGLLVASRFGLIRGTRELIEKAKFHNSLLRTTTGNSAKTNIAWRCACQTCAAEGWDTIR